MPTHSIGCHWVVLAPAKEESFAACSKCSSNDSDTHVNDPMRMLAQVNIMIPGVLGEFLQGPIEHVIRGIRDHAQFVVAVECPWSRWAVAEIGCSRLVLDPTGHGKMGRGQ